MASSLNKVELIGRLGKDPEVKSLNNGGVVANFSIATSETWKDKRSGEKQEKTEWHNIVVWNEKTVEFVEKYLAKGDLVRIEGKIQTRKWQDSDGKDRYSTEIVIPQFAPIDALMKLSFDDKGGDRDDRGSSRSSSRDRDDDRGSSRASSSRSSRSRDDDDDDRGSRNRSRNRSRDDRDNDKDKDPPRRAAASARRNEDLDDDIPF